MASLKTTHHAHIIYIYAYIGLGSSAEALAWHPSSQYLATGSSDRRCVVYDVSMSGEDPGDGFGTAQVTEDAAAWINDIAWGRQVMSIASCVGYSVKMYSSFFVWAIRMVYDV